jgi:hypothetical protein
MIEQARKNNGNPMDLFKQITNGYTPEQLNNLFNKAKQMGIPEEYINQVKDGINTKSVDIENIKKGE